MDYDHYVSKLEYWLVKWTSSCDDRHVIKLERCFFSGIGRLTILDCENWIIDL